jgi:hypothetical protein
MSDLISSVGESSEEIPYQDNMIIRLPNPQSNEQTHYSFRSPYEITINNCQVKGVITRAADPTIPILHIDISETEAQQTLSDFVTDIATSVGLKKAININNIALYLDINFVVLHGRGDDQAAMIRQKPQLLRGCSCDIVIEWSSFYITKGEMCVNLKLTHLSVLDEIPLQSPSPGRPDVLKIIEDTSAKLIDPSLAPKLYGGFDDAIAIYYQITN